MRTSALALLLAAALAVPVLAQPKEADKKVAIPTGTFFKGLQANQYLARERLIGAKVVNKDNQTVGTIDDLILNASNQVEGVVLGVGGFLGAGQKQIGVRLGALKIAVADGKTTVALSLATKEMLGAVPAYQHGAAPAAK